MIYLKALLKWFFSKDSLSNILFGLRIVKSVYTSANASSLKKNKDLLRKLEIAQNVMDEVQKMIPNEETKRYEIGINESVDNKTWGEFSASIIKNKHGEGRDGIDLGISTNRLGMPVDFKINPVTKEIVGNIGPLRF